MNKKANLFLNIIELLSMIFSLILLNNYLTNNNPLLLVFSILFLVLFVSSELFLFILLDNKVKVFYIFYIITSIIISTVINSKIPFSAIQVITITSALKSALRLILVDKIYIPKEFDYYSKMFGIKIKDFKVKKKTKKRKSVIIKNKTVYQEKQSNVKSYS